MTYTKEQAAAINAAARGESIAVKARAGSGKSFLLREIAKACPTKKIVYTTFNKHNVLEFNEHKLPNVIVTTAHSFGMSLLRHVSGSARLDVRDDKSLTIIKAVDIKGGRRIDQQKVWDMFRLYGGSFEEDWDEIIEMLPQDMHKAAHGFLVPGKTAAMLQMNKELFDEAGIIDYVDMIFLPVYLNLESLLEYDILMVDEAQDLPVATLKLLEHVSHSKLQVVVALDPMQNIYRTMGAGYNNLEDLMGTYGLQVMPLTTCFRCKSNIIAGAQRFVPDIESAEDGGEMHFIEELPDKLEPGAMVLAPTNGALVREFIPRRMAGEAVVIRGHNFFESVYKKMLSEHSKHLKQNKGQEPMYRNLVRGCIDKWEDLLDKLPLTKGNEEKHRFYTNCITVGWAALEHFDSLKDMRTFIVDMDLSLIHI